MLQKDNKSLELNKPIIIGIGGPNFSGYSILMNGIADKVGRKLVNVVSMDNFLLNKFNPTDDIVEVDEYALDQESPESFDFKLIAKCLAHWNQTQKAPFNLHEQNKRYGRRVGTFKLEWKPVIVLQGPLALWDADVRSFFDLSVYTDLDNDICLFNLVENTQKSEDLRSQEQSQGLAVVEKTIKQQLRQIKANVENHVAKTKEFASLILPNVYDDNNQQALELIIGLLKDDAALLQEKHKREVFQIVTKDNAKRNDRKESTDISTFIDYIDKQEDFKNQSLTLIEDQPNEIDKDKENGVQDKDKDKGISEKEESKKSADKDEQKKKSSDKEKNSAKRNGSWESEKDNENSTTKTILKTNNDSAKKSKE